MGTSGLGCGLHSKLNSKLGAVSIGFLSIAILIAAAGSAIATTPKPPKIIVQTFSLVGAATGFQTPVTASCPGGDICYALTGGSASGSPTGTATFTANIYVLGSDYISNNGSGGVCAPESGTMTVRFGMTGSIVLAFVGDFCDVGAAPISPNVGPITADGSFVVTGGSGGSFGLLNGNAGRGGGGSGTGRLTFSGDANGNALLWLAGIITFSTP
jgi:hypothetical protein